MSAEKWLAETQELVNAALPGPWEWEATSPRMNGEQWNLRVAGKPGIRMVVNEYQHGPGNANLIAAAPSRLTQATNAVQDVMDLHVPVEVEPDETICTGCGNGSDWQRWPCPTIRALDAALTEKDTNG